MKILFVTDQYIIDPLGIAWLSSYLREQGHDVGIKRIMNGVKTEWQDVIDNPPRMLCYSVTTGKHGHYQQVNAGLRMTLGDDAVSVFGGPHVTFFPEYISGDPMDFGVMGEGFTAIVDVANAIEYGLNVSYMDNVVTKDTRNPLRPLIDKKNMLLPDRDLIYRFPENRTNPIKNIMCSFGCVYSCPYCYSKRNKELYGINRAEIRSVESVMAEVEDVKRFPLELIFFQDDIFPMYDGGWLDAFCSQYRKYKIPFHIQTRVEFITANRIKRLKEIGLHGLTFAIESGNNAIRENILQRKMNDTDILSAVDILKRNGIKIRTENMIGVPGETWQTAMQTLKLNAVCKPEIAWASLYQPYPGTDLGDYCKEVGLYDGDLNDISDSFFDTYKLKSEYGAEFEKLQKLFSLAVEKSWVRKSLPLLTKLPFGYMKTYKKTKNSLYKNLYKV